MILPGWRKLSPGAVLRESGNAVQHRTGAWRAHRPVVAMTNCTHCMLCWLFCPDGSIETAEGRFLGIDLEHCKGCGICVVECPRNAIKLVPEVESAAGETR